MTSKLTTTDQVLRRVLPVVLPASAAGTPGSPQHFTETVLIREAPNSRTHGAVEFLCMDGFRMHRVEVMMAGLCQLEGTIVVGTHWLLDQVTRAHSGAVEITHDMVKKPRSEEHLVRFAQDKGKPATDVFDIGGEWPSPEALIDHNEQANAVGFNPQYLMDALQAAITWWEPEEDEGSVPIIVHQISKEKCATFSLRNHLGRLRLDLMPVVYDEDDEL